LVTVPGALEIPQAIAITLDVAQARHKPYDGAIALGCVIRGETSHYDIVAGESARALMDLAVALRVPIGNGILTVDTQAQALSRARPEQGDKGGWAVDAALSLVRLKRSFSNPRDRR
jgi:6,7-dimethyl-8-ribityllumazine synthase